MVVAFAGRYYFFITHASKSILIISFISKGQKQFDMRDRQIGL